MCRRIECAQCGRPTFAGCGAHVEQVLADVPRDRRCRCRQERAEPSTPERADTFRWLRELFARKEG